MSFDQLISEIEKLTPEERELVQIKLDALHGSDHFEETPEFIAFVEEGVRSAEEGPMIPIEEVIEEMKAWDTKSP